MTEGGTFEAEHAKACVILIFTLWEENYRGKIADIMAARKNDVACKLMSDVRYVRNRIIHDNGIIPNDFQDKLTLLSQIWAVGPGELKITSSMLHSLMEQINALRVEIKAP